MPKDTQQLIGAIALDLKRVAVAYQNNSPGMSQTFINEAQKGLTKLPGHLPAPIKELLKRVNQLTRQPFSYKQADAALTCGTLLLLESGIISS